MSACGYDSPFPPSTERAAPLPPLRFSRDRQDIAYLYRPSLIHPSITHPDTDHPSAKSGAIPADLTAALVSQWADLFPDNPTKNVGAGSPYPTTPRADNPDLAIDSPNQASLAPDSLILADWETYLSTHTTAHALPSGQLLLRPTATALGTWLWVFTHTCPPPPTPTDSAPIPFPQKQAPLAEALHLSSLALLQYTHMRCHQLVQRSLTLSPSPPLFTDPDLAKGLALALSQPTGRRLLRSLVTLVDHLAMGHGTDEPAPNERPSPITPSTDSPGTTNPVPPPALNQGFLKGYHLCESVDQWLREIVGHSEDPATLLLLQGISLGLAHLLQGWLQATAPVQL